jgi:RNA polymerase sigma factor (sigma-70 family)
VPRSTLAAVTKRGDQGCVELVHTSIAGSTQDESSRLLTVSYCAGIDEDRPFGISRSSFLRMREACRCPRLSAMPTPSPTAEPSDAFLLERVGRGHAHAYELIYNRYRHPANVIAYRLCGRRCIAEEVVQEALLAVWRSASTFTESRGSASAWIFTIVRNRALDACRRHGRIEPRETILDEHFSWRAQSSVPGVQSAASMGKPPRRPREGGRDRMALGFYITAKGFTQERYDTTTVQLEEAGAGAPDGRISHVALETNGEIQVFDVWESQEAFDAFGVTLLPILAAAGIEMNEPMVARVHNEIKG